VKDAPTRRLTKAEVIASWELMLALARDEMEATTNPELRAARLRDLRALEARLTEIRDRPAPGGCP
jgi:hypothetical protein